MAGGIRVIGGSLKGRRLATPAGLSTRPTADRVREAVFSILFGRLAGARVLDLFSGSGAMAIEALSRGAESAVAVDRDPAAIDVIRGNIAHCGVGDRMEAFRWDVRRGLGRLAETPGRFSLVFVDPPYGTDLAESALRHLQAAACLAADARIVVEHDARRQPEAVAGFCDCIDRRRYGKTLVSIFATMV